MGKAFLFLWKRILRQGYLLRLQIIRLRLCFLRESKRIPAKKNCGLQRALLRLKQKEKNVPEKEG